MSKAPRARACELSGSTWPEAHSNHVVPDLEVTTLEGLAPVLFDMLRVDSNASSEVPHAH